MTQLFHFLLGRSPQYAPEGNAIGPDNVYRYYPLLAKPEYRPFLFHEGRSRPIMLICETTNRCNNDCVMCPYGRQERPKTSMPLDLFDKVLKDYAAMGGGCLSLTPMVGEVFLDKHLVQRIQRINEFPEITRLSFTTNATLADTIPESDLDLIVNAADRIHISLYGLDAAEHRAITKRGDHERVLSSIRKIISLSRDKNTLVLGLRVFQRYDESCLRQWAKEQLGLEAARLSACRSYANWGGTFNTSLPLPLEAQWLPERINNKQCLIPLVAVQVFANGAVSFCPCCDYNAQPALALGNVKEQTLLDIFNGPENRALWHWEADGLVPDYCRRCTFHVPLESLPQQEYVFQNPFQFIGG